jgi:hypothetical protein
MSEVGFLGAIREHRIQDQKVAGLFRALADDLCRDVSEVMSIHPDSPPPITRREGLEVAGRRAITRITSVLGLDVETQQLQAQSDRARLRETRAALDELATNISCYLG